MNKRQRKKRGQWIARTDNDLTPEEDGPFLYWLKNFGWGLPRKHAQRFDVPGPLIEGTWEKL